MKLLYPNSKLLTDEAAVVGVCASDGIVDMLVVLRCTNGCRGTAVPPSSPAAEDVD